MSESPRSVDATRASPARSFTGAGLAAAAGLALLVALAAGAPRSVPAADTSSAAAALADGDRSFARGQVESAIAQWSDAYEIASSAADPTAMAMARAKRAEGYQALGFYQKSIADLEQAIDLARDVPSTTARLRGSLGTVLMLSGDLEKARPQVDACLDYAREAGDALLEARALNSLGALRERQGLDGAAQDYGRSFELAALSGDVQLAVTALVNQARVVTETDGLDVSSAIRARAGVAALALPRSQAKASALLVLARLELGALDSAGSVADSVAESASPGVAVLLDEAESTASQLDDRRSLSYALGYRARAAELEGRSDEALELTETALIAARLAGAPEIAYRWQWQAGRIRARRGELDAALETYRGAVLTLHGVRRGLSGGYGGTRSRFETDVRRVYTGLVELLLERSTSAADEDSRQALYLEARNTMELLKAAELEDYFQDDCVSALEATAKSVGQLSDRAAALYPIFLAERVELLLTLPGRTLRFTVPVETSAVVAEIERYRELLLVPSTNQYRRPAMRLYEWFIAPIDASLREAGIDTIVLCPTGRYAPFRSPPSTTGSST